MLDDGFTSVLSASSRDELLTEIVGFTQRLGFETVAATIIIDRLSGPSEFIGLDNTPAAYRDSFEDAGHCGLDPVAQYCRRHSVPIIWNQNTYVAAGRGTLWESQAQFGYHTGIALALHLPQGRHFFIGVDRDQALPNRAAEVARMTADLQLFAVYAQEAAQRLLIPPAPQDDVPKLTPRELESLRWTMEGKTAWEVGNILGISEHTAARHVNNATQKLGCANKLLAVLMALRQGLIR